MPAKLYLPKILSYPNVAFALLAQANNCIAHKQQKVFQQSCVALADNATTKQNAVRLMFRPLW